MQRNADLTFLCHISWSDNQNNKSQYFQLNDFDYLNYHPCASYVNKLYFLAYK